MNKIFVAVVISLFYIGLSAQTVTINYSEGAIISPEKFKELPEEIQKLALEKKHYVLTLSSNVSEYRKDAAYEKKNMIAPEIKTAVVMEQNEKYYYKDYAHNELLFEFSNGNIIFQGNDNLQGWDWKITEETKVIAGYKCQKATSEFLGYPFMAWFTKDLPKNVGPDKFNSLPGTILSAGTDKYEYTATSVTITNEKTVIDKPVFKDKTYTMTEVNDIIKKEIAAMKPSETTQQIGNTTTVTKTVIYSY